MDTVSIAKIAVDNTAYHFDKEYDYVVPEELLSQNLAGCRVLVPFGGGNRKRQGMVLSVKTSKHTEHMKPIFAVLDRAPLLSNEMISMVYFMKERYYCTFFDAIKTILPTGFHVKTTTWYHLGKRPNQEEMRGLCKAEQQVLEVIEKSRSAVACDRLIETTKISYAGLEKLVAQGIIVEEGRAARKVGDAAVKMVRLTEKGLDPEQKQEKLSPKQREVWELLTSVGEVSIKEICYFLGITVSVISALVKKGIAVCFEQEIYRNPYEVDFYTSEREEIRLTEEQEKAYESLYYSYREKKANVCLLYGVTGSGKTSVFMKLIDQAYEEKRGIIVMVPEISLTPQMIALFHKRYGNDVAIFHSALSLGERLDEWKRIKNGKAKIAVGTRSAIFAPFDDIGLLIIDEEQEYTYKSEAKPRFHARDLAKFRCAYHKSVLVLSSATPSIESYYFAKSGRYHLARLTKRYGGANLPEVTVIDQNQELIEGNHSSLSSGLLESLDQTVRNGKQAILLLNRRGYHTFASCKACGEVLVCPHCSISMTYHSANRRLLCHYCGYSIPFTEECPNCHEKQVRYAGLGTQRAEQELREFFPNARILRMDADTTMSKFSHEKKIQEFADGKYDIMIGTQMVAKGLDFANVTLVGVLSADQSLYSDDFRSYERTFALLTQVVGRSGRGKEKGAALIQTFTPENPIIRLAAKQDYDGFYVSEIAMRKALLYPPFADICVVGFIGSNEKKTQQAAKAFLFLFKELVSEAFKDLPLRVLGPSPASIVKVSNKYRYKLIIKFRNSRKFRQMMSKLLVDFGKDRKYADTTVFVDVNPDVIL